MGVGGPLRGSAIVPRRSAPDPLDGRMDIFLYRISGVLVTAGLLLTIVEAVATYIMLPVLGTVGLPVFWKRLNSRPEARLPSVRGSLVLGGRQLRVQPSGNVAVISSLRGRSIFGFRTAWPFKCTIKQLRDPGTFQLVGRAPLGLPILVAGWLLMAGRDWTLVIWVTLFVGICVAAEIYWALDAAFAIVKALGAGAVGPAA